MTGLNSHYVNQRIREYYPVSKQVTDAICIQITNGLTKLGFGINDFDATLDRYMANDPKADWPPNLRKLQKHLPQAATAIKVRPDNEKKVVIWPARYYFHPTSDQFNRLYRRGEFVEAGKILLALPGMTTNERGNAEAWADWADWWESSENTFRSAPNLSPEYRARLQKESQDTLDLVQRVMDRFNVVPDEELT